MNRHNVIWNGWLLPTTLSIVFFLCGCDKKATTVDREQTKRQSEATATSQQVPANGPEELRVLGEVPPFSLIDQAGEAFDRTKLDGKIWVSTFIFTRCGSTCPGKVAQTITQLLDQQSPNRADEVTEIAEPKDVRDPPWLAARAEAQIAKASQYNVVCDFKFTDELASSGIQIQG